MINFTKLIITFTLLLTNLYSHGTEKTAYPFVYIPGMFDNGEGLTIDSELVKTLNHENRYYYKNYFSLHNPYNKEPIVCSTNIVNEKYQRLCVANLIEPDHRNISLWKLSARLYALIMGKAPAFKNFKLLTRNQGCDYTGTCIRNGKIIEFRGLRQELWAKYGQKVYYTKNGHKKNRIVLQIQKKKSFDYYINKDSYFQNPDEIKFNIIAHSSGGLAVRQFIHLCRKQGIQPPIHSIVFLSVPHKGAKMALEYKKAIPRLIRAVTQKICEKEKTGIVTLKDEKISINYHELLKNTRVKELSGHSFFSNYLHNIINQVILYWIPYDGKTSVIARDPGLWDIDPRHRFIQQITNYPLPENLLIFNYRVKQPKAKFFNKTQQFLKLKSSDGIVEFQDTELDWIPNFIQLNVNEKKVESANHVRFPEIISLDALRETIKSNYVFLKGFFLKKSVPKTSGINYIQAIFTIILDEIGFNPDLDEKEDYSVVDHFSENPVPLF